MTHKTVSQRRVSSAPAPARRPAPTPGDIPTGREVILFVDDENMLADLGANFLDRIGYRSKACTSGEEALALFGSAPDDFDLVITDLFMPEMSGLELAAACRQIRPTIPVILCSGQNQLEPAIQEKMGFLDIETVLFKPFTLKNMSLAIRAVLDQQQPPNQ